MADLDDVVDKLDDVIDKLSDLQEILNAQLVLAQDSLVMQGNTAHRVDRIHDYERASWHRLTGGDQCPVIGPPSPPSY